MSLGLNCGRMFLESRSSGTTSLIWGGRGDMECWYVMVENSLGTPPYLVSGQWDTWDIGILYTVATFCTISCNIVSAVG